MDNMELSNYQESKQKIKLGLSRIAQGFVETGYELKHIRDMELYKLDGYGSITEFAKAEYNLEQWDTSRFIAIYDKYSDGSSPRLLTQYEGYKYGILTEMLSLSENEIQLVSLQTTRAEIREIKLVKKEMENEEHAPAHVSESLEFAQSEGDSDSTEMYIIPEADKLLIEFFRDKTKRAILKELAVLLSSNSLSKDVIAKAAELINPSGHLMHKKGLVIMMFEEDYIKYNRMGTPTVEYTYRDLIHDLVITFDTNEVDPWVAFYGETEPEPEPPKKEPIPEKKVIQDKPVVKPVVKTPVKPPITQSDDDEEEEDTEEEETEDEELEELEEIQEEIPGQKRIEDYPELLPEESTERHEERIEDVITEKISEKQEDTAEQVEVVEADIVETQRDGYHCTACSDIDPLMIANAVIISVNSKDRVLMAKWEYLGRLREKSIEINFCPVCGRKI